MLKKIFVICLSLLIATSFLLNNTSKYVYAATNEIEISSRANEIGGGSGGGGNFEYYDNGIIVYNHPDYVTATTTSKYTVYLPSSFINKINSTGSNPILTFGAGAVGGYIANMLGTYAKNPVVLLIVAGITVDWSTITYSDNGDGVTLVFGTGIVRPDRIISGKNHYATLNS